MTTPRCDSMTAPMGYSPDRRIASNQLPIGARPHPDGPAPTLDYLRTLFARDTWYWWDLGAENAVYQDSTAYTKAGVGDVVGCALDRAKLDPIPRRNLLIYTEDFSSAYWTKTGSPTITAGVADKNGGTSASRITMTAPGNMILSETIDSARATTGRDYLFSVDLKSPSGTQYLALNLKRGDNSNTESVTEHVLVTEGWATFYVKLSGLTVAGLFVNIRPSNGSAVTSETRDIFVGRPQVDLATGTVGNSPTPYQRVDAYPYAWTNNAKAIQATTANKPFLRKTSVSNKFYLDADGTDALVAAVGNLGASCSIARLTASGVSWSTSQTISSTLNLIANTGANYGIVGVWNRALTMRERTAAESVMAKSLPRTGGL